MSVEDTDFEYFEDDGATSESFEADARVAQTPETLGATGARAERDNSADPVGSSGEKAAEEAFDSDGGVQSDPDDEELYEIEFSDDDVLAYLEDEEGNEIGVVVLEDGEEVEYYYAEEEGVEYVSADDAANGDVVDDDEEELYEIEFSDDDVVAYLEDEEGNEIGVVVLEDGEEVEYYYAEEEGVEYVSADDAAPAARKSSSEPGEYDFGITKEGIAETTDDLNAVFREGAAMGSELKDAFADITEGFKDITGTTRPVRGRKK